MALSVMVWKADGKANAQQTLILAFHEKVQNVTHSDSSLTRFRGFLMEKPFVICSTEASLSSPGASSSGPQQHSCIQSWTRMVLQIVYMDENRARNRMKDRGKSTASKQGAGFEGGSARSAEEM